MNLSGYSYTHRFAAAVSDIRTGFTFVEELG